MPSQVVDKNADAVLDEVESAIYQVAQQILSGEGFSYGIPSRAKGNQMYVAELDRIVLKDSKSQRPYASNSTCRKAVITTRILQLIHERCLKRIHVTKRDLFYTDVKLFEVIISFLALTITCIALMHLEAASGASPVACIPAN